MTSTSSSHSRAAARFFLSRQFLDRILETTSRESVFQASVITAGEVFESLARNAGKNAAAEILNLEVAR